MLKAKDKYELWCSSLVEGCTAYSDFESFVEEHNRLFDTEYDSFEVWYQYKFKEV